jgi:sulfocyanin
LVHLTITARYNGSNGGFNFNGGSRGRHRITVPTGWRVQIAFTNADVISHSVAVVREAKQVPIRIEKPAFAGAASRGVERGIPAGTRQDDIVFVADRAGEYLLACGVPGHAAVGSYLRFTVSTDAAVPTYEIGAVAKRLVPQ